MLLAMYATLCEKTFYGLGWGGSCVPIADGISVMYKDPKVVCGAAEHYKYLVPSYISLVVYVAGVPAMVTGIVFYLRAKNLMADSRSDYCFFVYFIEGILPVEDVLSRKFFCEVCNEQPRSPVFSHVALLVAEC